MIGSIEHALNEMVSILRQVKWINKGVERGETLVSISTDGRVVEWSMKKGLSFSPLMVLKRIGECSKSPYNKVPSRSR